MSEKQKLLIVDDSELNRDILNLNYSWNNI